MKNCCYTFGRNFNWNLLAEISVITTEALVGLGRWTVRGERGAVDFIVGYELVVGGLCYGVYVVGDATTSHPVTYDCTGKTTLAHGRKLTQRYSTVSILWLIFIAERMYLVVFLNCLLRLIFVKMFQSIYYWLQCLEIILLIVFFYPLWSFLLKPYHSFESH